MSQPRITVITPSYNQGKYLERAICSVLDQGYDNLEYFVIDGGSWDESGRVIRHYANALDQAVVATDRGAAEAINRGIRWATGDFIAVLHADDLLLPGALHEVAQQMGDASICWAAGNALRIDGHDRTLGTLPAAPPRSTASFMMHDSGAWPSSATFWRRDLFDQHGLFDARLSRGYTYEHACRLLLAGVSLHVLPFTVAARREHEGNRSTLQAIELGMEMLDATARHSEALPLVERLAVRVNCQKRRQILERAHAEKVAMLRAA